MQFQMDKIIQFYVVKTTVKERIITSVYMPNISMGNMQECKPSTCGTTGQFP